jgi:hypothetical protein
MKGGQFLSGAAPFHSGLVLPLDLDQKQYACQANFSQFCGNFDRVRGVPRKYLPLPAGNSCRP